MFKGLALGRRVRVGEEGGGEHAMSAREALVDWAMAPELAEGEELLARMMRGNVGECPGERVWMGCGELSEDLSRRL
jgi:hypothetical protein